MSSKTFFDRLHIKGLLATEYLFNIRKGSFAYRRHPKSLLTIERP